jgi:hypothetical protein
MDDRRGKLLQRAAELKAESTALMMVSEELVGRVPERRKAATQALEQPEKQEPAAAAGTRDACLASPGPERAPFLAASGASRGPGSPAVTAQVKFPLRRQGQASWTRTRPWRSLGRWKNWPLVTGRTP